MNPPSSPSLHLATGAFPQKFSSSYRVYKGGQGIDPLAPPPPQWWMRLKNAQDAASCKCGLGGWWLGWVGRGTWRRGDERRETALLSRTGWLFEGATRTRRDSRKISPSHLLPDVSVMIYCHIKNVSVSASC